MWKNVETGQKVWKNSTAGVWNGRPETGTGQAGSLLFDTVKMEFVVERLAVDAEQFGGLRLVAARRCEGAADLLLLGSGIAQRKRRLRRFRRTSGDFGRQVAAGDVLARGEQRRRHHRVFQLPQVPRPVIGGKGRGGRGVEPDDPLVQLPVGLVEKEVGEERNIPAHLPQAGHAQREGVDAVVQVGAERPARDGRFEVLVGRGHETDVDGNLAVAADGTDTPLLQGAQQLHLRFVTQVPYFVEKQRASVEVKR